jgi:DNA-binding winged helix-turn-helix (wHTH) protein
VDAPSNRCQVLNFGFFEADLSSRELRKRGHRIHLQDQPFERPGDLVTREEVRKKLWPDGTYVDFDEGLDTALKKLRYALGDSAQNPTFIQTIPRRGYRFVAPVSRNGLATYVLPGNSAEALADGPPKTIVFNGHDDAPKSARTATPRTVALLKYALAVTIVIVALAVFRYYKRAFLNRLNFKGRKLQD